MSLERVISRAVSVLSQEADVASGNDVDGRLSLSSANNIQHRPVYTRPITSTELAFSSSVCGSLVDRGKETRAPATVYVCMSCVLACVRVCRVSVLRHNCRAFVSYTRIIGSLRHVGSLPTFFFGRIERRVFPLYSKGI